MSPKETGTEKAAVTNPTQKKYFIHADTERDMFAFPN